MEDAHDQLVTGSICVLHDFTLLQTLQDGSTAITVGTIPGIAVKELG